MGVLVTDEDNFDNSSLFLFRNDPQECCEEKAINSRQDLVTLCTFNVLAE